MSPSRRTVLSSSATIVTAGAAGCLSLGPDTSSPDPAECPDGPRVPDADRHPEGEDPPPIPDPPESLDEESVVAYVEAYELAYVWRRSMKRHGGRIVEVRLGGSAETGSVAADGVVAEFEPVAPSGEWEDDDGGAVHFDEFPYSASYLVTEDAVWRAESEKRDRPPAPPSPRQDGELLECFDG